MPAVKLHIESKTLNWEATLTANGNDLGVIKLDAENTFEIPGGEVVMQVRAGKAKSNKLTLKDIQAGDLVDIKCDVNGTVYSNAASLGSSQAGCLGAIIIMIIGAILDTIMPTPIKLSRMKR